MNEDFSELIEYLDKKFTGVDKKFEGVDRRFNVIDEKFANMEGEMAELKSDFRNLQDAIDEYAKKADTYFQEMLMLSHKVDRLERWVLQLAEKIGVQLKI